MKCSGNEILESFDFKKKFGQNFIIDSNVIKNIVSQAEIDKDTLVVEIGPGAGALTCYLAIYAKYVLCYEIDTSLKEILSKNTAKYDNVSIIYKDFLECNILEDIKQFSYKKIYLISNLPYYITTPIFIKIVEQENIFEKMYVMVQKDVLNRFLANNSYKERSYLSTISNYYFNIRKVFDVSRNVFFPKPNVDSVVIEFIKKDNIRKVLDRDFFHQLIKDSFKYKRKNLHNNLKHYNLDIISGVLKKYNMDLKVRAENLDYDIYVDIANELIGYDK